MAITFLDGRLEEKSPARAVLNVGGVGYEVFIPLSSFDRLPGAGQACRILIYEHIREDQHALFGFMTEAERRLFVQLLSVSGIGPKIAMSALGGLSVRDLIAAVGAGDIKRLSSVSGIGRKLAERMVVELKDKFSEGEVLEAAARGPAATAGDRRLRDAIMALITLGYKQADAQKMVAAVMPALGPDATVEQIVSRSLTR